VYGRKANFNKSNAQMGETYPYGVLSKKLNISIYEEVRQAYDNLFRVCDVDGGSPSPIDTGDKKIVASNVSGMIQSLSNYQLSTPGPAATQFKNLFLQHANPSAPILQTSEALHGAVFATQRIAEPQQPALLEVYNKDCWGFFRSRRGGAAGVLSVSNQAPIPGYSASPIPHKWVFETGATATVGAQVLPLYFKCANDSAASFGVFYRVGYTGAWTGPINIDQNNVDVSIPGIPVGAATLIEIAIQCNSQDYKILELEMLIDTGLPGWYGDYLRFINPYSGVPLPSDYPQWIYNLDALLPTNFNYINNRSDGTKMNRSTLIMTDVMATLYTGGNMQAGKIYANDTPQTNYETYLYSLEQTY